jgi:hypothetical protein
MADEIVVATTDGDYEFCGGLIREYWDWLHARYADLPVSSTLWAATRRWMPS